MRIFISIITTLVTIGALLVGVYYFLPLSFFGVPIADNLGVSYTTISGSDTMSTFPTTYNANNALFDEGKMETSTTSIAGLVTAENLVTSNLETVGTISSGVWNGTPIPVAYYGTGTTSPSENQIILGDTTNGFKVVDGFGTLGQVLESQGVDTPPLWSSVVTDQTANYTWTGVHEFRSATTTILNLATSLLNATSGMDIAGDSRILSGGLGVGMSTTTDGDIRATGLISGANLHITGRTKGAGNVYNYSTSTGFTITSDHTEVVEVGFRPKSIVGTIYLNANSNGDIFCMFNSYEDNDSYVGESKAGSGSVGGANNLICESDQASDDIQVSISAVDDTSFTITWNWIAGAFASGTYIEATVIGLE